MLNVYIFQFADFKIEHMLQQFFDQMLVLFSSEDFFESDINHWIDVLCLFN